MKYPLDKICVKSGTFCPSCQRKLSEGIVEDYEIEIMKALMELEDNGVKELRKGEYAKAYIVDNKYVVVLRGDWSQSELQKIGRELARKIGKRVKIVIDTSDIRKFIEQALSPASVYSINRVWLPDGSEQLVVLLPSKDRRYIRDPKAWSQFLSKHLGKDVRIKYL